MKLSSFNFNLPSNLITPYPPKKREDARLMVINRAKNKITHHTFADIASFFRNEDVIVLNNSRVFPGQLHGYKGTTEAHVVIILLRELDPKNRLWDVLVEPSRKIRVGNKICIGEDLVLEVIDNTTSCCRTVKFCFQGDSEELANVLQNIGEPPLPSLLKRTAEGIDRDRYQTVYAKHNGSVVAPSAGFHFTKYLLKSLQLKGIRLAELTLHLGINTLKLLNTEDLVKCRIHSESFNIPEETALLVNEGLAKGKKICAVGTSTLKAIESSISGNNNLRASEGGWTSNFINPPYPFKVVNTLLTNFHPPRSIDFINTVAFGGPELMMRAYEIAVKEKYRFSVYGDACLIL